MEINRKERRPLATRDKRWAQNSARWSGKRNVTPNQISLASIVCHPGGRTAVVGDSFRTVAGRADLSVDYAAGLCGRAMHVRD